MGEYLADPFFGALFGIGCAVLALTALALVLTVVRRLSLRLTGTTAHEERDLAGYRCYFTLAYGSFHFTLPHVDDFAFELETSRDRGVHFISGAPEFDRLFLQRHAAPAVHARLWANTRHLQRAAQLLKRRSWAMNHISIDGNRATFSFKWRLSASDGERVRRELTGFLDQLYSAALFPPLRSLPTQNESAGDYRKGQPPLPAGSYMVENVDAEPSGPYGSDELLRLLHDDHITPMTRVADSSGWRRLGLHKELRSLFEPEPEPAPRHASRTTPAWIQVARYTLSRFGASRIALVLMAIFWGLSGVGAGHAKVTAARAAESASWPRTSGTIVESRVVRHTSSSSSRNGTSSNKTTYSPKVVYRYRVRGKQHESDRLWFGESTSGRSASAEIVALYPVGLNVRVFYRPSDPTLSVLRAGEQVDMAPWMVLSVFLFFVLALMVPTHWVWQLRQWALARRDPGTAAR